MHLEVHLQRREIYTQINYITCVLLCSFLLFYTLTYRFASISIVVISFGRVLKMQHNLKRVHAYDITHSTDMEVQARIQCGMAMTWRGYMNKHRGRAFDARKRHRELPELEAILFEGSLRAGSIGGGGSVLTSRTCSITSSRVTDADAGNSKQLRTFKVWKTS